MNRIQKIARKPFEDEKETFFLLSFYLSAFLSDFEFSEDLENGSHKFRTLPHFLKLLFFALSENRSEQTNHCSALVVIADDVVAVVVVVADVIVVVVVVVVVAIQSADTFLLRTFSIVQRYAQFNP